MKKPLTSPLFSPPSAAVRIPRWSPEPPVFCSRVVSVTVPVTSSEYHTSQHVFAPEPPLSGSMFYSMCLDCYRHRVPVFVPDRVPVPEFAVQDSDQYLPEVVVHVSWLTSKKLIVHRLMLTCLVP
ncbi:hypothetical protein L1987_85499 [Smallanthus sonchifolius]|uniref:Uncharacterized protein n=1 Tax=Smallanthus sonchifolius TaxID=185202 RepID=A0ACB8XXE2_9ASTR|nr:hypothetical protein L1987_85499 [Smallanthus sonchifolius]